jgi:hypothetical protein
MVAATLRRKRPGRWPPFPSRPPPDRPSQAPGELARSLAGDREAVTALSPKAEPDTALARQLSPLPNPPLLTPRVGCGLAAWSQAQAPLAVGARPAGHVLPDQAQQVLLAVGLAQVAIATQAAGFLAVLFGGAAGDHQER